MGKNNEKQSPLPRLCRVLDFGEHSEGKGLGVPGQVLGCRPEQEAHYHSYSFHSQLPITEPFLLRGSSGSEGLLLCSDVWLFSALCLLVPFTQGLFCPVPRWGRYPSLAGITSVEEQPVASFPHV